MYLGVDQSLRSPGLAVVDGDGRPGVVKNLKNTLKGAERLALVRDGIMSLVRTYQPEFAALEGYSINSINRPFDLGEVGGIVRLTLYDAGIPFIVVTPTQLKKFVTGSGAADKEKVQKWVREKWKIHLDQDDQADAFGLAQVARVYCTHQSKYRSELEVVKTIEGDGSKLIGSTTAKGRIKIDI